VISVFNNGVKKVHSGPYQNFMVKNESNIYSTGFNNYGQLIDGTQISRYFPVPVQNSNFEIIDISLGYGHTLVLKTGRILYSIGYNIVFIDYTNKQIVWTTWCWKYLDTNSIEIGVKCQSRY
jgi:alpha-tubulin suppressor-like RCC1 family protein